MQAGDTWAGAKQSLLDNGTVKTIAITTILISASPPHWYNFFSYMIYEIINAIQDSHLRLLAYYFRMFTWSIRLPSHVSLFAKRWRHNKCQRGWQDSTGILPRLQLQHRLCQHIRHKSLSKQLIFSTSATMNYFNVCEEISFACETKLSHKIEFKSSKWSFIYDLNALYYSL